MGDLEFIFDVVARRLPEAGVEHNLSLERDLKPLCEQFADEAIYGKLVRQIREVRSA